MLGRCGRWRAWRGHVVGAEGKTLLVSGLRYEQRLKAEGRMSLGCGSWVIGVVVESAGSVGGLAMTVRASRVTGTRSSSVTSWVCEAAAQAAGRVVEASTFASWVGLRTGFEAASKEAESSEVVLCQAGGCGCMCVVVGVAGSRGGRRCFEQHTDARAGVAPGGVAAQDDHFRLQEKASRHDST